MARGVSVGWEILTKTTSGGSARRKLVYLFERTVEHEGGSDRPYR